MADVTGIYYDLDEPTLLQMKSDVLAQITAARTGQRYESMGFSRKTFTKANLTYEQLQVELLEIQGALAYVNPALYGTRRRRLVVSFNGY
jgi:hypothetical protein